MKYEYRHERIQARVPREVWDNGRRSEQQVYSEQDVQETLNRLGADGWELVSMEPKWIHSAYYDFGTVPDIIECWYATFKRPLEQ